MKAKLIFKPLYLFLKVNNINQPFLKLNFLSCPDLWILGFAFWWLLLGGLLGKVGENVDFFERGSKFL